MPASYRSKRARVLDLSLVRRIKRQLLPLIGAVATLVTLAGTAHAVPSFSRKYGTSCQTCHTHYPVLNPFGEAFRRNGYRFPSRDGSSDSDVAKEESLELGQPEDQTAFPRSVWPSRISEAIPISVLVNVALPYALPESDRRKSQGNSIAWNNAIGPIMLYAAGSFGDKASYYTKLNFSPSGSSIGAAFLLFNDLIGPRHLVNLWIGRLLAPQLTSYASGGTYLTERAFPPVSVAGLLNANHSFILGQGPANGIEVNGIAWHRFAYSMGWLASSAQTGMRTPTSEDFYGHLGTKLGGTSLDGEGSLGTLGTDVAKPWAETSLSLDVFAYRGVTIADNYTKSPELTPQRNVVEAIGIATRLQLASFSVNVIVQGQNHFSPFAGSDPRLANPPEQPVDLPGTPNNARAKGFVAASEMAYVVYPWLVPALRAEHTVLTSALGDANFSRLMPGLSVLLRPNIRAYLYADMQRAHRTPPQSPGYASSWDAANGTIQPPSARGRRSSVEAIMAHVNWAF